MIVGGLYIVLDPTNSPEFVEVSYIVPPHILTCAERTAHRARLQVECVQTGIRVVLPDTMLALAKTTVI